MKSVRSFAADYQFKSLLIILFLRALVNVDGVEKDESVTLYKRQ